MSVLSRFIHLNKIDKSIENAISVFNVKDPSYTRKRMRHAYVRDDWNPDEYILFNYELLSPIARKTFVCQNEGAAFRKVVNPQSVHTLFLDKGATYRKFSNFYGRSAIVLDDNGNCSSDFTKFVNTYPKCIIKSLKEAGGNGIRIFDVSKYQGGESMYDEVWKEFPGGAIMEELIQQHEALASFHPESVNTIRLTTIKYDNKIDIIRRPFIRFGQGNSVVDNGSKGGLIASIDFSSGIITSVMDEMGKSYLIHPDSKKTIVGFRIPYWEEAKSFAIELMKVVPESRYVGWDLALTEKGWIMVEGNSKGLFIGFQLPNQLGFRDEYEEIKRKLNISDILERFKSRKN